MTHSQGTGRRTKPSFNCFICEESMTSDGISLMELAPHSRSALSAKVEKLLGSDCMVIIAKEDQLCQCCYALLSHCDKLETDLNSIRESLRGYINQKYNLESDDFKTAQSQAISNSEATMPLSISTEESDRLLCPPRISVEQESKYPLPPCIKMYKCKLCNYKTSNRIFLTNHLKTHSRIIYKCSKCERKFDKRSGIEKHIIYVHHSDLPSIDDFGVDPNTLINTFECGLCSVVYLSQEDLTDHLKEHNQNTCNAEVGENQVAELSNIFCPSDATWEPDVGDGMVEPSVEEEGINQMMDDVDPDVTNDDEEECDSKAVHIQITGDELETDTMLLEEFETDDLQEEILNQFVKIQPKPTPPAFSKVYVCSTCGRRMTSELQMKRHIKGHSAMKARKFVCDICDKVLTTSSNLKRHVNQHDLEPVSCTLCAAELRDRLHLKAHLERFHTLQYKCSACDQAFSTAQQRRKHEFTHKHFKCPSPECGKIFLTEVLLKNHRTNKHGLTADASTRDSIYKCHICDKVLTTLHNLRRHMLNHEKCSGPVSCGLCEQQLTDRLHLRQHLAEEHPETHQCGFCSKIFSNKKHCKSHELTHPERLCHKCDVCSQDFPSLRRLKRHRETAHREPQCRFCGKEILNISKLISHEKRHSQGRFFPCITCSRVFYTPSSLKNHMSVHTGEYKIYCSVCSKGFHSESTLAEHLATHTKEIRYTCELCGRNFSSNSTYRIHRIWHDNPLPYKCNVCDRKFRHTSLLAVHKRRVHTGERPYKCSYCPFTFSVSSSLNKHLILHTKEFPYKCGDCDKGYTTRTKLSRHMAKSHNDFTMMNERPKPCEYRMVMKPEELALVDTPEEIEEELIQGDQGLAFVADHSIYLHSL